MRDILLDTSALIAVEAGEAAVHGLPAGRDTSIAIAAISLAELELGVELARGRARARRRAFADWVRAEVPVIPSDEVTALHHASLLAHCRRAGAMRGAHDLVIAATARATGRRIVTLDRRAFADLPRVRVA